eukprot:3079124-Amphidinium_carterae.2
MKAEYVGTGGTPCKTTSSWDDVNKTFKARKHWAEGTPGFAALSAKQKRAMRSSDFSVAEAPIKGSAWIRSH